MSFVPRVLGAVARVSSLGRRGDTLRTAPPAFLQITLHFRSGFSLYRFPKILSRLGNSSRALDAHVPAMLMLHLFTQRDPGEREPAPPSSESSPHPGMTAAP